MTLQRLRAPLHALVVLVLASLATRAHAHPLDALGAAEIADVRALLRADQKLVPESRFSSIDLSEPDKAAVLAWRPGEPVPRRATAHVLNPDGAYEAELDLVAKKVLAWRRARGEPMLLAAEVGGATELALSSPQMVEGLAKRGIRPEQVFCAPLTAGAFGGPDERGRRLRRCPAS